MRRLFGRLGGTPSPPPPPAAPPGPPAASAASTSAAAAPTSSGDARRIDLRELRSIVADGDELRKGTDIYDRGGLSRLARHGERIFCEAAGSGSSPYRVTIAIPAGARPTARCSCMAARSRPFCKHAAALLVAWSRAPEAFVVAEAPPVAEASTGGGARRATVRTGKAATADLHAAGVAQALALVRELAAAGVASAAVDRPEQIRGLAETLRANRLRRLSARVHELADLLGASSRQRGRLDALAYATVVGDILLTARRLERHLGGETLEDRHVEELIGRNWRKTDRTPVDGLELAEYAYLVRATADEFVIRERRLLDLATGTHYSEKQILPGFMARRTPPIASEPGVRATGTGRVYPGFAPHRLDTEEITGRAGLTEPDVRRIVDAALPGPTAALAAFGEHRRDVFAPDALPLALRVDAIVAVGVRLAVVGAEGDAIILDDGEPLVEAVADRVLSVVIGDVDLDGILAVLRPLAAVVEPATGGLSVLITVPSVTPEPQAGDDAVDWLTSAQAAGASPAALSLAEIRDELAVVLVNGLGSLTDRVADPLATRLGDLGLERPASLLREIAARPDPADRLDDLVRLLHVLAVGAVRLAGTRQVDRSSLVRVPGHPALLVADPGDPLPEEEVARRRSAGTMGWAEAAVHRARRLAALPPTELAPIVPWWADATAVVAVVDAVRGDAGVRTRVERAVSLAYGLTAALTGVAIAAASPDPWADSLLESVRDLKDPPKPRWFDDDRIAAPQRALRMAARRAIAVRRGLPASTARLADPDQASALIEQLTSARSRDARKDAARELTKLEDDAAVPSLRRAFRADPAAIVRIEAAWTLATLGDVAMVDAFVDALAARSRDPEAAKGAAYGLGLLGDVRGVRALLEALAEGWRTSVVLAALEWTGELVMPLLLDRVLAEPSLAGRQGFVSALRPVPPPVLQGALAERLHARPAPDGKQQVALLRLAAAHKPTAAMIAQAILALPPDIADAAAVRSARSVLTLKGKARPAK